MKGSLVVARCCRKVVEGGRSCALQNRGIRSHSLAASMVRADPVSARWEIPSWLVIEGQKGGGTGGVSHEPGGCHLEFSLGALGRVP